MLILSSTLQPAQLSEVADLERLADAAGINTRGGWEDKA